MVDKFTAQGNLTDNIAMASFDPPLNFSLNVLHLENRNLSKVTEEFIPFLVQEISKK